MPRPASFDELVASRSGAWWRLAWLLTGDSWRAQELLELALSRVWRRWGGIDLAQGGPEAAVRRELVTAYLETARRSGANDRSQLAADRSVGDVLGPERETLDELRARVLMALAVLAADQRAAVALSRSAGLSGWDGADALDVSRDQLTALVAEAEAVATASDRRGGELLRRVADVVPDPPYDAALAARARARAGAHQRRRRLRSAALVGVLAAVVVIPVLVSQDPTSGPGEGMSAAAREGAAAERLVDPLPIPEECAEVPDDPPPPDIGYDPELSEAVWLRFCPALDVDGRLRAIAFAPQTTLVSQGVDDLLDRWTTASNRQVPCTRSFRPGHGTVRTQVGTLDGALHIVDMRVGACGSVSVDGQRVGVSGREAFADAVRLLGAEQLEQVDDQDGAVAEPLFCPTNIEQLARFTRTTVPDYPQVEGLPLPLPAEGGLVCRYPRFGPAQLEVTGRFIGPVTAEQMRAAYLARLDPAPSCGLARRDAYGVVLGDVTGSRRAFTVDLGSCGAVHGPLGASGSAGPWLTEVVVGGRPTGFGTNLTQ